MIQSNSVEQNIDISQFECSFIRIRNPIAMHGLNDFQDHVAHFSYDGHLLGLGTDGGECGEELPGDLVGEVDVWDGVACADRCLETTGGEEEGDVAEEDLEEAVEGEIPV